MNNVTQYKALLEVDLQQIIKDLEQLGIHNPEIPTDWIATTGEIVDAESDENLAADRSEDWQEHRGTVAVLEPRYNNIVRALKKARRRCASFDEL